MQVTSLSGETFTVLPPEVAEIAQGDEHCDFYFQDGMGIIIMLIALPTMERFEFIVTTKRLKKKVIYIKVVKRVTLFLHFLMQFLNIFKYCN